MHAKISRNGNALYAAFIFVLFLPLFGEFFRRFIFHTYLVFLANDLIVLMFLVFLVLFKSNLHIVPRRYFFLLLWTASIYALVTIFFGHGLLIVGALGIRDIFMPFMCGLCSAYFVTAFADRALVGAMRTVNVWIILIACVAVLQLVLGQGHPINELPIFDKGTGIGDYAAGDVGLSFMFRPTSIFMHTGKFGQAIFLLVLFKWTSIIFGAHKLLRWPGWFMATIPFDLVALIASGQRAAMLLLILFLIAAGPFMIVKVRRQRTATPATAKARNMYLRIVLFSVLVLGVVGTLGALLEADVTELAWDRLLTVIDDVAVRGRENVAIPMAELIGEYLLSGSGAGYFNLGAEQFGGARALETLSTTGTAENSWLRLLAELGLPGLIITSILYGYVLWRAWRDIGRGDKSFYGQQVFFVYWFISMLFWANTHDTLSNSVVMYLGFGLSGFALVQIKSQRFMIRPLGSVRKKC
ncbi:MAG: O-antigen ligase family protein [Gammaproteobacteria bacterium]|nr:O-antigen ligase family protein [Gammaproteobacteria bacterium]MDH3415325.1 O-antigen ligase family protein [Gammaproteobacteria bacterium]